MINNDIDPDEPDPLEPVNRRIDKFNDYVDGLFILPMVNLYKQIAPHYVRTGVTNFTNNFFMPFSIVAYLMMKDTKGAQISTARFFINSTFGLLGIVDVADKAGCSVKEADFNTMFKHYGRKPGPYIVFPILGPTCARQFGGVVLQSCVPYPHLRYMGAVQYLDARSKIDFDFSAEIDSYATKRKMTFDYQNN